MTRVENWSLVDLTDTEPNRDMGDLTALKNSIAKVGLICPLAIDNDGKLLAGRRRYHALVELGWKEAPCVVFPAGDEVLSLRVTIDENFKQKPLLHPERAAFIKQFHDTMCKRYGQQPRGKHRSSSTNFANDGWSHDMTATELGVSRRSVGYALKIAEYVENNPEAFDFKGSEILKSIDRERRERQDAQAWKSLVKTILEEEKADQEEKDAIKKASEQSLEDIEKRRTELEESLEWTKRAPLIEIRKLNIKGLNVALSNLFTLIEDALQRTHIQIASFMVLRMVRRNLKKRSHYPTSVSLKTLTKTACKMILKENKSIVFEEDSNSVYRLVEAALKALADVSIEDETVLISERIYRVERLKK